MMDTLPKKTISLAAGLLVALAAFFIFQQWVQARTTKKLEQDTNKIAQLLIDSTQLSIERIVSISSFYAASQEVEREEFRVFVGPYLVNEQNVHAYEWAPLIMGPERSAFEEKARQEGLANFQITERSDSGGLVEALPRGVYYPVYYIEPVAGNEMAFGFDLASNLERQKAMSEAVDQGKPVASPILQLVQQRSQEKGFLVFLPIFRNGLPADTVELRRRNLRGVTLAVFSVDRLMQAIFQEAKHLNLEISLSEALSEGGGEIFYASSPVMRSRPSALHKGFSQTASLAIAGRRWILECRPTRDNPVLLKRNEWGYMLGAALFLIGIIFSLMHWHPGRRGLFRRFVAMILIPPIKIMNLLDFAQKFILIGFLFILPLSVVVTMFFLELGNRITFSQKEIYGIQYLDPLQRILGQAARSRTLVAQYSWGDVGIRPEVVQTQSLTQDEVEALGHVDDVLGGILQTGARYENTRENFRFIKKTHQIETSQNYDDLIVKFISEIREFISYVGDASNLILDPDLDTYYLMDAALLKFPELQVSLGKINSVGYQAIRNKALSIEERADLIHLHGIIKFNFGEIQKGFGVAFKNNPSGNLKTNLDKPLSEFENEISFFLERTIRTLTNSYFLDQDAASYDQSVLKNIQLMGVLQEQCMTELRYLLKKRIDGFVQRRNRVLIMCLTLLPLALYMWLAFYTGFKRTVSAIESASNRMAGGGDIETTQLETRDELGRVVQSFNKVALRLRQERDAAKEGEERFRIVAESTSNLIYEWHIPTGRLDWTGKIDEYLGCAPGEFPRTLKAWEGIVHPDDRPRVMAAIERHFTTREPFLEEYRILKLNGEVAVWMDGGNAIWTDNDKPEKWVGAVSDITKRRQLESQLIQSQKMETVGNLAGGIAHDLNNQLTPIRGYMDMILSEFDPKDPLYPQLAEIQHAAKRCAEVVQGLLDFSRPSSRKKSDIKVAEVLKGLKATFPNFLPSTIETSVVFDEKSLGKVWGNDTELQMVFMNFVANARDSMPKGGQLTIEAENEQMSAEQAKKGFLGGDYVRVAFRDSGTGMSPELLARIFEPFFSTKEKGKGTGLGLSMVFNIVKDHGGWVDVSSQLGVGTTFQVYFPVYSGAARPDETKIDMGVPFGTETILLADDEETLRKMGKSILERLGYKVLLASNGLEAINIFKALHFEIDALVLDMTMPKLTGRATIQGILEIDPLARIVLASGFTSEGGVEDLIKAGVKDYIKKPYSIAVLAQTLRKVLDIPK